MGFRKPWETVNGKQRGEVKSQQPCCQPIALFEKSCRSAVTRERNMKEGTYPEIFIGSVYWHHPVRKIKEVAISSNGLIRGERASFDREYRSVTQRNEKNEEPSTPLAI